MDCPPNSMILFLLQECNSQVFDDTESVFTVINAFDVPRFTYNTEKKKYALDHSSRTFIPNANKKSEYLKDRFVNSGNLFLKKHTLHCHI